MDTTSLSDGQKNRHHETDSPHERLPDTDTGARIGRAERHPRMKSRPRRNDDELDEPASDREEIIVGKYYQPSDAKSAFVGEDTPLHIAVRNEDYDAITRALLYEGAEINARDASGKTALHIALEDRNLGLVESLMPFSPDLELRSPNGMTPLHSAVTTGWEQGTRLLLCYNLDINATDADGNTVLHFACSAGYKDVVKLLLESGANVHIRNSNGRTPLQLAVASRTRRLPELLLQYGASIDDVRRRTELVNNDNSQGVTKRDPEILGTKQDATEVNEASDLDSVFAKFSAKYWDGVRRDNGDGLILANYDSHDIFFDAKVESIRLLMHEGQEMHAIQLKLNFMKPFSNRNRIRYAKVDVKLAVFDSGNLPHIHSIMPQADRVEVSEQEISSGQTLTVGASGGGGPSNVNISMEGSKSRKSTFKGVRIIHGVVKDRMHASWRMYEEPGSQSGLPEIVRLLLVVQCKVEFDVWLSMSVKACHAFSFGIPRTLAAKSRSPYRVPDVATVLKLERAMKLKNILNVADRAATSLEEATTLEREFARSIKNHSKKGLIMKAGLWVDFVREWSNIADASREGDITILHDKLMQMEVNEYRQRFVDVQNDVHAKQDSRDHHRSNIDQRLAQGEDDIVADVPASRTPSRRQKQCDWELLMDQRILAKNDIRQDMELAKQQQEIERLERQLAKSRVKHRDEDRGWVSRRSLVKEEIWEDDLAERLRKLDMLEASKRTGEEQKLADYLSKVKRLEEIEGEQRIAEEQKMADYRAKVKRLEEAEHKAAKEEEARRLATIKRLDDMVQKTAEEEEAKRIAQGDYLEIEKKEKIKAERDRIMKEIKDEEARRAREALKEEEWGKEMAELKRRAFEEWQRIEEARELKEIEEQKAKDKVFRERLKLESGYSDEHRGLVQEVIIEPEYRSSRIRETTPRRYRSPSFRRRRSNDFEDVEKFDQRYGRETGRSMAVDFLSRERPYNSQAKTAMESFSAVGPGYKVLRLA
ncbi:hypothetical protein UA08_06878 [Talaromyces atroroseus]|uniref:Uncharacterized protein n=1 Tax=Talaromyces atroroseus TaxID=1441469 RepID=A0A225ASL5_TALAT|nr:hypothetical protein UA08_06878 [Talaromyces atroroseus]OKL57946.1 hypothetical protein UA08_06878 [Talaromyces atroroseus]